MKKISISLVALILMFVSLLNIFNSSNVAMALDVNTIKLSSAKSYIVLDDNGVSLLESNADEKFEVASICKLMTVLIVLENIEAGNITLDTMFTASDYACMAEGSQAFLDAGCEYSVRDLLKSIIVASANDSAIVVSENLAGSEYVFVGMMNDKARDIGMKNTLYANSTGLHDKNTQYSTARDTAIILSKISQFDVYKEDCKIWMDTLIHPSGRKTELVNTNRLIKYYPYTLTGKTGYTDEAGYCLSSTAKKNGLGLTCVVLGCSSSADRFSDSVTLYNYAYANYRKEKIIDIATVLENDIIVEKGKQNYLDLVYEQDYYLTRKVGADKEYELRYNLPDKISAPIMAGDVVGNVEIIVGDSISGQVNIIAEYGIERQEYKDIIGKIINKFSIIN